MTNWICKECGAQYLDNGHQEPAILKQDLEIKELKDLLKQTKFYLLSYWKRGTKNFITDFEICKLLRKIEDIVGGER